MAVARAGIQIERELTERKQWAVPQSNRNSEKLLPSQQLGMFGSPGKLTDTNSTTTLNNTSSPKLIIEGRRNHLQTQ